MMIISHFFMKQGQVDITCMQLNVMNFKIVNETGHDIMNLE